MNGTLGAEEQWEGYGERFFFFFVEVTVNLGAVETGVVEGHEPRTVGGKGSVNLPFDNKSSPRTQTPPLRTESKS